MARSCQMGINKAFLLWKLELRRSKEETAKIKRTLAARNVVNGFYRKYIRLARHGLTAFAYGIALTKGQQKVMVKLNQVYYVKVKKAIMDWKVHTWDKTGQLIESKKARTIDKLIQATYTGTKKYIIRWARFMHQSRMREHGERVKAFYIMKNYFTRHKIVSNKEYYRHAWWKLSYDPKKILQIAVRKMIQKVGTDTSKAFMLWQFYTTFRDKNKRHRTMGLTGVFNLVQRKLDGMKR